MREVEKDTKKYSGADRDECVGAYDCLGESAVKTTFQEDVDEKRQVKLHYIRAVGGERGENRTTFSGDETFGELPSLASTTGIDRCQSDVRFIRPGWEGKA